MTTKTDGHWQTLSANGDSDQVTCYGRVHLHLSGNFGTGTAKLVLIDGKGVARDVAGASFSAATEASYDFPARSATRLYVNLTGATAPTLVVGLRGENR